MRDADDFAQHVADDGDQRRELTDENWLIGAVVAEAPIIEILHVTQIACQPSWRLQPSSLAHVALGVSPPNRRCAPQNVSDRLLVAGGLGLHGGPLFGLAAGVFGSSSGVGDLAFLAVLGALVARPIWPRRPGDSLDRLDKVAADHVHDEVDEVALAVLITGAAAIEDALLLVDGESVLTAADRAGADPFMAFAL